jgi:hypothetical protein
MKTNHHAYGNSMPLLQQQGAIKYQLGWKRQAVSTTATTTFEGEF